MGPCGPVACAPRRLAALAVRRLLIHAPRHRQTAPPLPFRYRHRRLPCAAHKRRIRLARVLDDRLIHGCPCPLPRVALDPIVVDRRDLIQRKKRERLLPAILKESEAVEEDFRVEHKELQRAWCPRERPRHLVKHLLVVLAALIGQRGEEERTERARLRRVLQKHEAAVDIIIVDDAARLEAGHPPWTAVVEHRNVRC